MNPFKEKVGKLESFESREKIYPKSYDKETVHPYTKLRIILLNGAEFEAQWFLRNMARHSTDDNLRKELAVVRRIEQQQQKGNSFLKPKNETILETTIGYEQLAVELTTIMAQKEKNKTVKGALDFALLEDFDHLYRYADLLDTDMGIKAEKLIGRLTEIMPGRPTISEHRYPKDDIRSALPESSDIVSKLHSLIITAAEQQTMNYYMNQGTFYDISEAGRKLYMEIAMIEEQHVSMYESLVNNTCTWAESWLMHEYTECYLYHSAATEETDEHIRKIWLHNLEQEIAHLHKAAEILEKYEGKHWSEVIPDGEFPDALHFNNMGEKNRAYIRSCLKGTIYNTSYENSWVDVNEVPDSYVFFKYNATVNGKEDNVASHKVIERYIMEAGEDYRFTFSEHPVKELRDRTCDNINIGRKK